MKLLAALAVCLLITSDLCAAIIVSQTPVPGGGVSRWSQLWVDPGPNGNDLDGDSKCWQDFTLSQPALINGIEWWGTGACELGFRVEVWRQDPGTIAYQPLAVFDGQPGIAPLTRFTATPDQLALSVGGDGITHYLLNLDTPINIAANDAANPRWFIGVIGLTHQAYYTWNWSQGIGPSHSTFQFVRGGYDGGNAYRSLGDARAITISDVPEPGCVGAAAGMIVTGLMLAQRRERQ